MVTIFLDNHGQSAAKPQSRGAVQRLNDSGRKSLRYSPFSTERLSRLCIKPENIKMVARRKLKGIDGRAPPEVEPAA